MGIAMRIILLEVEFLDILYNAVILIHDILPTLLVQPISNIIVALSWHVMV